MSHSDLRAEIKALQLEFKHKEELFDFGMHNDKEFGEMKKMHLEMKELKKRIAELELKNQQLQKN